MGENDAYKLKINEAVRWSPIATICLLVHVYRLYFFNHSYLFSPQLMCALDYFQMMNGSSTTTVSYLNYFSFPPPFKI